MDTEKALTDSGSRRPSLRHATIWSYSQILGKQAITAVLSFALAAMLGPEAFGVIAMALVFIGFIQMLQQQGLMPAIIARHELTDLHKSTAFWLVVGAGSVLSIAGFAVAPLWAQLNQVPELTQVIQVLALTVPLSSSVVVHEAILRRNLEFRRLAIRSWASVIAGGIAGVIGALVGWGLWALVAQQVVTVVVEVIVLWGVSPWRPTLVWSSVAARELWSYSVRSGSSSLGLFLGARMDVVLGGALFGPSVIGIYRMGQRVTEMALDVSARGMQSVSLPVLAEQQRDPVAFARQFHRMLKQATSLSLPLLGLVAGLASCIERFLGNDWRGVAAAIVLLAVVQAIRSVSLMLGPALQAFGRPGTLSLLMWIFMGMNVIALLVAARGFGASNNLVVLCVTMIVTTLIFTALMVAVSAVRMQLRISSILLSCLPGVLGGLGAAGASFIAYQLVEPLPWLVAGGIGGSVGLVVAVLILLSTDKSLQRRVVSRFGRRRRNLMIPAQTPANSGSEHQ